jgi:hypothetical protein
MSYESCNCGRVIGHGKRIDVRPAAEPPRERAPGGQQQREPGNPAERESITPTRPRGERR